MLFVLQLQFIKHKQYTSTLGIVSEMSINRVGPIIARTTEER